MVLDLLSLLSLILRVPHFDGVSAHEDTGCWRVPVRRGPVTSENDRQVEPACCQQRIAILLRWRRTANLLPARYQLPSVSTHIAAFNFFP